MITSVGNPAIRRARRLRKRMWRERTSRVLVEGHRAVRAAASSGSVELVLYTPAGARLRSDVIAAARAAGGRAHEVSPEVMSYLASATTAPSVIAVAPMPQRMLGSIQASSGVIAAGVHDPATLGSILATSVAAGAHGLVIGPRCADVFAPKCLRSGQGAQFLAPPARADLDVAVAWARARGSKVVALTEDGAAPWDVSLGGPVMVLVAPEGADADERVAVPSGSLLPSLSARVAVVLYEWVRQGGA